MRARPLTLKQANALVDSLHRHHKPVRGHRFSIGLEVQGKYVGAAIVGRPVARNCEPYTTAEVTRLVTDGTKNACSFLYAACARAAEAMGFDRIQTYILSSETGASLRAAGWTEEHIVEGRQWEHTDGKPRRTDQPTEDKIRWAKVFI